jgi:hypothetical protein
MAGIIWPFVFLDGSELALKGTPLPRGYFWRKILVINGLQGVGACKILITKWLCLKYLLSVSYVENSLRLF